MRRLPERPEYGVFAATRAQHKNLHKITANKASLTLTQFRHSYNFTPRPSWFFLGGLQPPALLGQSGEPQPPFLIGRIAAIDLPEGLITGERSREPSIMSQTEFASEVQTTPESEYQDRAIKCVDCGEIFIWTGGEQVFFHDKGLKNEPKRCKTCKQAKNERLAAIAAAQSSGVRQRIEVSVQCAQCGQQTTVPFYPSQGRPVYCRSCFLASRNNDGTE